VLYDADGADVLQKYYVYGNYIDEVLMMNGCSDGLVFTKFYAHDHLYSPAALMNIGGTIERYEYDAYGKATIRDASYEPLW